MVHEKFIHSSDCLFSKEFGGQKEVRPVLDAKETAVNKTGGSLSLASPFWLGESDSEFRSK